LERRQQRRCKIRISSLFG